MQKRVLLIIYLVLSAFILLSCNSNSTLRQLEKGSGDYICRINVKDYGYFDFRIFSDEGGTVAEDFVKKAQNNSFAGMPIVSIIDDYCIVFGSNTSGYNSGINNTGSKSDINNRLLPLRGAICAEKSNSTGSDRFMVICSDSDFILNLDELLSYKNLTLSDYLSSGYGVVLDEEELDVYRKNGGAPWLLNNVTVFGQIYDGFDCIDKIVTAITSEDGNFTPAEEILIESIEIK